MYFNRFQILCKPAYVWPAQQNLNNKAWICVTHLPSYIKDDKICRMTVIPIFSTKLFLSSIDAIFVMTEIHCGLLFCRKKFPLCHFIGSYVFSYLVYTPHYRYKYLCI